MRGTGPGGFGAPAGPDWSRRPGGLLGYCFDGFCTTISSCFYTLCCCWLLQDCFGRAAGPPAPYAPLSPPGPPAPYAPLSPPGPPPSVTFGSHGPTPPGPFEPPGPAGASPGPPHLW